MDFTIVQTTIKSFYPNIKLDLYNYYSSAIKFFTKEHKPIFDGLIELYENNSEELDKTAKLGGGKVQTICNYEVKNKVSRRKSLISGGICFQCIRGKCSVIIGKTELIRHHFFIKYSWIWHYTGFFNRGQNKNNETNLGYGRLFI